MSLVSEYGMCECLSAIEREVMGLPEGLQACNEPEYCFTRLSPAEGKRVLVEFLEKME